METNLYWQEQINGFLGLGREGGKRYLETLQEMEMFVVLIVVMASRVYTYVKNDQTVYSMGCLLYFIPQ